MTREEIEAEFEKRAIRHVRVGGFDIDGVLRGKFISKEKFFSSLETGFGFCDVIFGWDINDQLYDNATVTGWSSGYPDALAKIDTTTMRFLPDEPDTAHFLVDYFMPNGKPHPACPRNLLKTVAGRALNAGYEAKFACELEFWAFSETPHSASALGHKGMKNVSPGMFGYSWIRADQHGPFLHDLLDTCAAYDIEIEGLHTETGPGVYEAAIRYDEIVRSADKAALFKTVAKRVAHRHGMMVTFMAKWNAELPGSSGHLHQSLWDTETNTNVFAGPRREHGLSEAGERYLAGVVTLTPELTALYAPFINSYRRYVPGMWAPLTATWGVENRTCSQRVINGPLAKSTRIEHRQTAADLNPYISMATCLASGLHGIERALELPAPTSGDATAAGTDVDRIPVTLDAATQRLAKSEVARELLGEAFVDHYVRTRDWEVREARKAVTDWELSRYFELV